MDKDEKRSQLIALAQSIAMQALEIPLDRRQEFIEFGVAKIRKDYERKHGPDPAIATQASKLLGLTKAMVKILEESGGKVGHA